MGNARRKNASGYKRINRWINMEQSDCAICGGKDSHHVCYQCFSSETERIDELEEEIKRLMIDQERMKIRMDATSRLLGTILTDAQTYRIILNLLIDDKIEKIIREKYPEFVEILRNRHNILKRLNRNLY